MSTIGPTLVVKGEVRSTDDLTIAGRIEGDVLPGCGSVLAALATLPALFVPAALSWLGIRLALHDLHRRQRAPATSRVLLHLVDGTAEDVQASYRTIRGELKAYGHGLAEKPEIVALNKIDALDAAAIKEKQTKLRRSAKKPVHLLSGVSGEGRDEVLQALYAVIEEARNAERRAEQAA